MYKIERKEVNMKSQVKKAGIKTGNRGQGIPAGKGGVAPKSPVRRGTPIKGK